MSSRTPFRPSSSLTIGRSPWRLAFWLCLCAVLTLALMPPAAPMPTTGWDKSNHLLAFATLGVLGWRAYPSRPWLVPIGLLVYGGLIEWLQSMTPYRSADAIDVLADGLGLALGWLLHGLVRSLMRRLRAGPTA
ncbi:VanZ family protein [Cupriavidus sp. UGS-1]|uniref:VanZ family protein n=1 Tax=Cupriavidus sp. UGS-1 TaxID=2899826 RepID=UPI001E495934|nr:VanZ family protein [Cupriavidus sp. UGS-1]MCD9121605.1 VanZ family protein [Cupriavidus sp. UGS-1]